MKNQEQKTILLVEDDPGTMMLATHLLKGFGYNVIPAKSGEEAIQIATGNDEIALILTDVNLGPGIDGPEAARQILAKRNLPIVFLSSHTEKEYVERIKGIAGYGYVVKNSGDIVLQSSIEMALNLFNSQEALRKSEEQHRNLLETSSDFIYVINQDDTVHYVNPAALKAIRCHAAEVIGKPRALFFPPAIAARQKLALDRVFATGEPLYIEQETELPGGGVIWQDAQLSPIKSPDGKVELVLGISRDITERKRAEYALQESEEKFRTLFENAGDAIFLIQDAQFIDCNVSTIKMFGCRTRDQIVGHAPYEFSPTLQPNGRDSRSVAIEKIAAALTGHPQFFEWIHTKLDATPFPAEVSLNSVKLGDKVLLQAIVRDISERKRVEEVLRSVQAFQKELLLLFAQLTGLAASETDAAIDSALGRIGLFLCADRIYIFEFNPTCTTMSNTHEWCNDEIVPEIGSLQDLPCTGFPMWVAAIRRRENINIPSVKALPDTWRAERHILESQGIQSLVVIPIISEDDAIGFVGLDSVRGQKVFSPEELKLLRVFGGLVSGLIRNQRAEAVREKLEGQLCQAQKMKAVGQLAGSVAHDFNNQLQVILTCVEMSLNNLPPEQAVLDNLLQEIRKATHHSADLTKQLLAFSQQQVIKPVALDMNAAIAGSLKMLGRLIGENISLTFAQQPALDCVFMDPNQVDQILVNLTVNARDAIAGTGHVAIAVTNVSLNEAECRDRPDFVKPGNYVMLVFQDNGAGMTPETQARIFEPFFTTKGPGKGTGLGLATVYGIVKQNHGAITVQSTPGQGSTFSIYLPRLAEVTVMAANETMEQVPTGNETVLVVEDDALILSLTQRVLSQLGYKVLSASTQETALTLCEQHPAAIHLLLTDVIMPDLSGSDLAERIQQMRPGIRVLFMSGYPADIMEKHGHLAVGKRILQKPFNSAMLAQYVRAALDLKDGNS